jgi:uncharacterized protein
MEITTIAFLVLTALVAGFVDSIAGGGGLLALPALLLAGLDPVTALATNKFQGSFATGSATLAYWRKGYIRFSDHKWSILVVFVASALGASTAKYAPRELLSVVLPIMLIAIAIYFAVSPRLSDVGKKPRIPAPIFALSIAPAIAFYDGIFGPGAGSFYLLGLVTLLGLGVVQATATTKLLNFTSNFAAFTIFALSAKIFWLVGLLMGLAQFSGAQLGSRLAMRHGAKIIRPLLVVVCCAMAVKLMLDPANPLRAFFP